MTTKPNQWSEKMTIQELKELRAAGRFHHATYRSEGTLLEGLWIYQNTPTGFRGYEPAGAFFKDNPDLDAAYHEISGTGVSLGSYGNG